MGHKLKYIFLVATCFTFMSLFFHCKKYPENKGIHLAKPEKRIIGEYIMTEYTVNGDDSLPFLSSMFNKNISDLHWNFHEDHGSKDFDLYGLNGPLDRIQGFYSFSNNSKDLNITFLEDYYNGIAISGEYNPFSEKTSTWHILKLYSKNNKPTLKIKREFSGKTYIIQFN